MATRPIDLQARLDDVERALAAMEQRVAALESVAQGLASSRDETPGLAGTTDLLPAAVGGPRDLVGILPLAGGALMALGGAFLLRALTDSGRLQVKAGVALGLLYSIAWLLMAFRAASRGHGSAASFHGLTSSAVGLAILWEASTRFTLLSPAASAVALGAFAGGSLLVAWRGRIHTLAAVTTLGTIALSLALIGVLGAFVPFTALLVALGLGALWMGYECDWYWLRWPAAFVANLALAAVTSRALSAAASEAAGTVLALQVFLLAGYLASFAVRTLARGRRVIPFEVVQTLAALAVGLGGAVAVADRSGAGEGWLGLATTLLGVGSSGAAFAFLGRRVELRANFYFYASLALLLTATGLATLLPRVPFALACSALALAASWAAVSLSHYALSVHGAVYAVLAAAVSGLLGGAWSAFVALDAPGPAFTTAAWSALVAAAGSLALPRPGGSATASFLSRWPRLVIGLIVLAGTGAAVVLGLVGALAGGVPSPGLVATLRTAVLAAAAVLLALATRHARLRELGWWLYPVLAVGGAKLVLEDFRRSEPAALFVALALFGAALVAAPRLVLRDTQRPSHPADTAIPPASS